MQKQSSVAFQPVGGQNRPSIIALFFIATFIAIGPRAAHAGGETCADLFRKASFFAPSADITNTGRVDLKLTNSTSSLGRAVNSLVRQFYPLFSVDKIQQINERLVQDTRDMPFWIKLSDAFGLQIEIDPAALASIPRTGPLLILSNHPHHGPEGIAIAAIISKIRPDIKIVLTPFLRVVPGIPENSIFTNPYASKEAIRQNVAAQHQMRSELKNGHALLIFAGASVSGKSQLFDSKAMDSAWKDGAAALVRYVPETQVMPILVDGQTSQLFQTTRFIADRLPGKTLCDIGDAACRLLHVREIGQRKDSTIRMVIGEPVTGTEVNTWGKPSEIMAKLRDRTYALQQIRAQHSLLSQIPDDAFKPKESLARIPEEIPPAGDMKAVYAELDSKARVIYDMAPDSPSKRMKVYLAKGADIPVTLQEVGRLREITFREVHEGSGFARDLDPYDTYYYQLIVVDKKTGDIAGGYRLGPIDEILKNQGYDGIYSAQFFDHSKLVLDGYLKYALELGRSYVVPEYQRSMALLALFNGIGRFIVENPRYRYLMGAVSISDSFTDRSKGTILTYLFKYHESPEAAFKYHDSPEAAQVRPLAPLEKMYEISAEDKAFVDSKPDFRALSKYVDEIENAAGTGMSMPPLFGIYTNLGAEFFRFNVDHKFNSLDGFIAADLVKLPYENLKNYMGDEGAQLYRQSWATEIERLHSAAYDSPTP